MCLVRRLGEARVNVDKETKPIFHKANLLPYSIKEKREIELERLLSENIFQLVEYFEWLYPIEPVKTSDESIRVFKDYKVSINKAAKRDKYDVPKLRVFSLF